MLRFILVFAISIFACSGQNFPSFNWMQEVGGTGADSFTALATDPQGNIYVTGTTSSPNFPVQSAAQSGLASAGLYRVTGSSYASLGLNNVTSIAIDPANAAVIYAASSGAGIKSVDGGNTWTNLPIPAPGVSAIVVDPFNDQNLYAVAGNALFNSADAGVTWTALNTPGCGAAGISADPNFQGVLFADSCGLYRSSNGGASWQSVLSVNALRLDLEPSLPGVIFVITEGTYVSTDDGQTFQQVSIRGSFGSVVVDPNQPGRLLGANGAIFASTDNGATWTQVSSVNTFLLIPANGFLYAEMSGGLFQLSADLQTATPVGPPGLPNIDAFAYANGNLYVGVNGGRDIFITKLDPSGNVVYSTYFGGSNDDYPIAIAIDSAGGVYVTGRTQSSDFPVTPGAYLTADPDINSWVPFLFKLNPDGSRAYSTYFTLSTTPVALAVDSAGSAYLTGTDTGGLPTTPGAYQGAFCCYVPPNIFFTPITNEPFLTKFDPTGSTLIYSTYLGQSGAGGNGVAIASDGTAYVAGMTGVGRLSATGSALLASATPPGFGAQLVAIGPGGDVYLAGGINADFGQFQPSANAFQTTAPVVPFVSTYNVLLPSIGPIGTLVKMDAGLQNVLAATYYASAYGDTIQSIAVDASGNAYVSGLTQPRGLPTVDELAEAEGPSSGTGFLAQISADFSTLLFSTYLGDTQYFDAGSVALSANGAVVIGGSTVSPSNVYLNSVSLPAQLPPLRIDSIRNAASLLGGTIAPGETIDVVGTGFGAQPTLLINGSPVPVISQSANQIVAAVPAGISPGGAPVQVATSAGSSNQVVVIVAPASPGIFSADGSGVGQAYILNEDGSFNSSSSPASTGSIVTIFATGGGSSGSTPSVFIDGIAASVVSVSVGGAAGLPGSVYQVTAVVPSVPGNPPSQLQVLLEIEGAFSQGGVAISVQP